MFIPTAKHVNKKGEKLPTLSNDQIFSVEGITTWLATTISDIERVFSKRVVLNIMNEQTESIILLRNGGKPKLKEDFDDMDKIEQFVVTQFDAFIDKFMFKQQRILWFYADPKSDKPLDGVNI